MLSTRTKACLVLATLVCLVACGSLLPRQSWDEERLGPVIPHDTFPADCSMCHEGGSWTKVRSDFEFDHLAETGVPLNGAHAEAACLRCHNDRGPVEMFASRGCAGCHEDIHRGRLGPTCEQCHNEETWQPIEAIALHASTRFPLVGPHASAECFVCHEGAQVGNFEGLDPACEVCHTADLARAVNPDHIANGWISDCQRCHSQFAFQPADFVHPSSFPLTSSHGGLDCSECHTPGDFTGLSTDCAFCHTPEYNATTDPNHMAAGFSTDCAECHDTTTWGGAGFIHTPTFPLDGGHNTDNCSLCHTGGVFTGTPTDCVACHLPEFNATTSPNHVTSGFGTDCAQCHDIFGWEGADFEHTPTFPLTNGHDLPDCMLCHVGGVFTGLSTDCAFCHTPEYNATTDPNHMAAGFSTDCAECHDTTTWGGAGFIHTPTFPLDGGHNTDNCSLCHTGGVFTGTPTDCVACHLPEFNATTSPNHVTSGFGTDCAQCHDIFGWEGADFEHTPTFPLTNGHDLPDCMQCHVGGVFTGLSTDCSFCHTPDFNATTDPQHASAGFSLDCAMCHETVTWDESTFVHAPSFPLTNGHNIPGCNVCHVGNVFAGLPADCVSCHLPEYNATTNPDHAASGFPTDCAQCHDTTNWNNANFNHSFPIDSGAHRNLDCIDCHTVPANTPDFTCIECHEHRQSSMDNEHGGVPGYVWESMACLNCHPNGRD